MPAKYYALLRLSLGFIFLWSFLDKLFGLGFGTPPENAWLTGASPTLGYLSRGTYGPFATFFQSLAGNTLVDWLFMLGLLFVGTALILGIGIRLAGYFGALMMLLIWLSAFPPKHNPFLDEHLVYLLILLSFTRGEAGNILGLGRRWSELDWVKKYPLLR